MSQPVMHANRAIRRAELRKIVPLSDTTIYELEQRGEFPKRFYLTARCAAWDLGEVLDWLKTRKQSSEKRSGPEAPCPDVHERKSRPTKQMDRRRTFAHSQAKA